MSSGKQFKGVTKGERLESNGQNNAKDSPLAKKKHSNATLSNSKIGEHLEEYTNYVRWQLNYYKRREIQNRWERIGLVNS